MKTSLAWLNQYLEPAVSEEEAAEILTQVGFPVEEREQVTLASGGTDVQLDVEITSNRSDALSHVGLAREIAAATGRTLSPPSTQLPDASNEQVQSLTSVDNTAQDLCPVYTARVIRGVKVGPSPQWLVDFLEAAGLRSVNNVVDVTNYVLLELGQPLHAFDMAKLEGQRIVVRRAEKNERFTAIDHSEHTLRSDMLVIADAARPVAVAGVMGGLDSEVGEATADVLLESARFDSLSVRRTSRALKLASDSSYRFERGVDPLGVERASQRATALILELAGGALAEGVIRAGEAEPQPTQVALRPKRCAALLGVDLSAKEQGEYLQALGLAPQVSDEQITCTVPTFRLDLVREVDLIEEVARLYGMDRIPVREQLNLIVRGPQSSVQARDVLASTLVAHGYHETITPSFLSERQAVAFVDQSAQLTALEDESKRAESTLRPSVLPSLLVCRKANQDAGNDAVQLFETASVWRQAGEQTQEQRVLAMLADADDAEHTLRAMRGAIVETVERLGGAAATSALNIEAAEANAQYAVSAKVKLHDKVVGQYGLASTKVQDLFSLQTRIALAELDLSALMSLYPPSRQVGDLPRFPGIERDLSIVVDEAITWARIEQTIRDANLEKLELLQFVTVYRGKPIAKGQKSVSLRLLFRDPQQTLRHEQVDPQVNKAVGLLEQSVGATLRA